MNQPLEAPTKPCPRCHQPFPCRPGNCWCSSKSLPATILEAIKKDYTDCLCEQCLNHLAAEPHPIPKPAVPNGAGQCAPASPSLPKK